MNDDTPVPWPFPAILIDPKNPVPPPLDDSPATYDDMVEELGDAPW